MTTPAGASAAIVLRPEWLIDGVADVVLRHHEVVVEGGVITAKQPVDATAGDGRVVDLPGTTILPGLIDVHVHYTIDGSRTDVDAIALGAVEPSERAVLIGARNARVALRSGVTTARSAGASRGLDIALAAAIEAGDVPGPRLLPAGQAITITGGHGRHFGIEVDGLDEMVRAVRALCRDGAKVIKLVASEAAMLVGGLAGVPELSAVEMTRMTIEAKRLQRTVLAHAQTSAAVVAAARAGVDSVEHAFLADEEALTALAVSNAYLTPTLAVTDVYSRMSDLSDERRRRQEVISVQHRASCEMAVRMGIPLVAGTDCGVPGVLPDMLALEVELLRDHGLSTMAAIRAATVNAARLVGLGHEVGTIEVGKRADLVGVEGDLAADITCLQRPVLVMKHGEVVRMDNAVCDAG